MNNNPPNPPCNTDLTDVERLWLAIKHGDEDHQAWLREAIAAHFAGQPIPAPRGKGNKEAEIERLKAQIAAMPQQPVHADEVERLTPEEAWEDLVEKDDRTSPEEYPEMCLITREELASYMNSAALLVSNRSGVEGCHGLDTPERVCFYEQDFYVLSNFSAFRLLWKGLTFDTLEAAYHWEKFPEDFGIQTRIRTAPSAHEAFKIAGEFKDRRRPDWDEVKVSIMRDLLRAKVGQHEYVHRKLLATGNRELVENSWRDDYWGWGPNRNGLNMLGKLWMEVREEARTALDTENSEDHMSREG